MARTLNEKQRAAFLKQNMIKSYQSYVKRYEALKKDYKEGIRPSMTQLEYEYDYRQAESRKGFATEVIQKHRITPYKQALYLASADLSPAEWIELGINVQYDESNRRTQNAAIVRQKVASAIMKMSGKAVHGLIERLFDMGAIDRPEFDTEFANY